MTEKQFEKEAIDDFLEKEEMKDIAPKRVFHEHLFIAHVNKNTPSVTRNQILTTIDRKIELFLGRVLHRIREILLK